MAEYKIPTPPKGKEIFKWLGPGLIWMFAATGSGELLFTPRVASMYGYTLLWALLLSVILKWFINYEIGRFTIHTGTDVLAGFKTIKGPKNWAVWIILIPQLAVAIGSVAGLAGTVSTALIILLPGSLKLWTTLLILFTGSIVFFGGYKWIEKIATFFSIIITLVVVTAAISTLPEMNRLFSGLIPRLPQNVEFEEVLPWVGFMLAGAAGLIWHSNWLQARGYGLTVNKPAEPIKIKEEDIKDIRPFKKWLRLMAINITLAMAGAVIIAIAFLVLGSELLFPKKLIPEEEKIAEVLATLLSGLWGQAGYFIMILAIILILLNTTISNMDGFSRMFTSGTQLVLARYSGYKWLNTIKLNKLYIVILMVMFPIIIYLLLGDPIALLKIAGIIQAAQIPFVAILTMYLNRTLLPASLKPSVIMVSGSILAALFFTIFAAVYVFQT